MVTGAEMKRNAYKPGRLLTKLYYILSTSKSASTQLEFLETFISIVILNQTNKLFSPNHTILDILLLQL